MKRERGSAVGGAEARWGTRRPSEGESGHGLSLLSALSLLARVPDRAKDACHGGVDTFEVVEGGTMFGAGTS